MRYLVNKLSVIFLDRDKENGFNTVAYYWPTDELMAIRPKDYFVLKYISDAEEVGDGNLDKMATDLKINISELREKLSVLASKGILETI